MARAISALDFAWAGVAIEDELEECSLDFEVPEANITSFADAWQNFLAGKSTVQINANGFWDPASSQGDVTLFGDLGIAAQTYDAEPDGATGYDGYAILTSYSIRTRVNEPITYSFAARHNGQAAAADAAAPQRA